MNDTNTSLLEETETESQAAQEQEGSSASNNLSEQAQTEAEENAIKEAFMSQLPSREVTRHETTLSLVPETIQKGPLKGTVYVTFSITEENLTNVISYYSPKVVAEVLQSMANRDNQQALFFASIIREQKDDKTGKVIARSIDSTDHEKLLDAIASGKVTGEKISDLQAKVDDKTKRLITLTMKLGGPDGDALRGEIMQLSEEINNLNKQIEDKRRPGSNPNEE
jgi:hypothetical protein